MRSRENCGSPIWFRLYERRETLGFAAFICLGTGFAVCWAWSHPLLEVHLIQSESRIGSLTFHDFQTEVSFRRYLREERKFDTLAALAKQIDNDIKAASVVEWQTRGI